MYTCSTCKQNLSEDMFWKKSNGNKESSCKICRKAANRAWREANKEQHLAKRREYDRKTAKKRNADRRAKKKTLSDEQLEHERKRQSDSMKRTKERRIAEYIEKHGSAPLCECGCGQNVNFDCIGKPNKYIIGHMIDLQKMLDTKFANHYIPAERVRDDLYKIRVERGWTVKVLAEHAGLSLSHMRTVLYDKKQFDKYGFEVQWVENMFRRLNDLPAPPTTYMLKKYKQIEKYSKALEKENI